VQLVSSDKAALKAGSNLMKVAGRLVDDNGKGAKRKIGARDVADVAGALKVFQKLSSKALQADLKATVGNMKGLEGRTLKEVFERVLSMPTPARKAPARKPKTK
jgi:hypothetical protein